jgi:hypothetical protein
MSAGILLRQHEAKAAFILTDSACYFDSGVVAMFRDKCQPIPELHCAVLTFGPMMWSTLISSAIRERFTSFDQMKAGIEPLMREIFYFNWHDVTTSADGNATELWVVGWSESLNAPDAFPILLYDLEDPNERFRGPNIPPPFTIDNVQVLCHTPSPTPAMLEEARLPFSLSEMTLEDLEQIRPDVDLLHLLEIQRRIAFTGGSHKVGGYAQLTSVDRNGVRQRRIHEWAEDKVGELIKPLPVDWIKWRADREKHGGTMEAPPSIPITQARPLEVKQPISLDALRTLNRHERRKLRAGKR